MAARKIVYADTGHVSMLERPARFNQDVRAFLQEEAGKRESGSGTREFAA